MGWSGLGRNKGKAAASNPFDYNSYTMPLKEKVFHAVKAGLAIYFLAFLFYRSHMVSLLLCPLGLLYPGMKRREIAAKRKGELNVQFKELLYSLSSSLSAGKSLESAFRDALKDLAIIYPNPETCIIREVDLIVKRMEMNIPLEDALMDFARRSQLEDIENFADVVGTCKRLGGNLIEAVRNAAGIINEKIEINQEIDTMLAERKLERKILNVLPLVLILILSLSAEDYVAPVYETAAGRLAMTLSAALLAVAYFLSKKIMDLKV